MGNLFDEVDVMPLLPNVTHMTGDDDVVHVVYSTETDPRDVCKHPRWDRVETSTWSICGRCGARKRGDVIQPHPSNQHMKPLARANQTKEEPAMRQMLERVRDLWVDDVFCRSRGIRMRLGETFSVTERLPQKMDTVWLPLGEYVIVQTFPEHGMAEVAKMVSDAAEGEPTMLHFVRY